MPPHMLIVDDDPVQRRLIEAQIGRLSYSCESCSGGTAALELLSREPGRFGAMILDLLMPDMGGIAVMAEMRRRGIDLPIIVQTAKGGIEAVVEAMRSGAFDFVVKPASPERLASALADALRVWKSPNRRNFEAKAGRALIAAPSSPAMRPVMEAARKAAASTIPILIEGETGVGKEWLAETIRAGGPRAAAPFVTVNCGALPLTLVESILFGHEKGAFTDAGERRVGKFVEADGGTLLLDEIGDLPAEVQVKLLRVLQKGEVDPVGGRRPVQTNVRILSATNRDLADEVRQGRFREDLYYRLSVLPIRVPPLRERREEIGPLASAFLERFAAGEPGASARRLAPEALAMLCRYDWPGNIRQLENAVHRAVVIGEGPTLRPCDFPHIAALDTDDEEPRGQRGAVGNRVGPAERSKPAIAIDAPSVIEAPAMLRVVDDAGEMRPAADVEADLIRLAVVRYEGRMSEIARRLGIGRSTLYRKMRRLGIDPTA